MVVVLITTLKQTLGIVVKTLLEMPASPIRVPGLSPSSTSDSSFLQMHFLESSGDVVQLLGSLLLMWETRIKFPAPDFSLASFPAVAGTWKINQEMEDAWADSVTDFQINKKININERI